MKCITISGSAGHGKDTLAHKLKETLQSKGKKVFIIHYADYLKMIATQVYNWNGVKDEVGRDILQKLGDKMRSKDKMYLINELVKVINLAKDDFDIALIPDARFPIEIECLKNIGRTISVHINRVDYKSILTTAQNNHRTERALDNYTYDYDILTYTNKEIIEINKIIDDILS